MSLKQPLMALATLGLFVSIPAAAKSARRRMASVDRARYDSAVSASEQRPAKDVFLRLGVASGYSQSDSNVSGVQKTREQGGYHQDAYVGVDANLTFKRYAYADVEGFFAGTPGSQSVTTVNTVVGHRETASRRLQTFGSAGELGGRLPLFWGPVKIVPSLGAGFGYVSVREFKDATRTDSDVWGPYGSAGLGFGWKRWALQGDASLSFLAKGSLASTGQSSTIISSESAEARFNRIRAGAYYRLSQPLTLGVQYIRRQIRNQPASDVSQTETTNQVLGTMVVHF